MNRKWALSGNRFAEPGWYATITYSEEDEGFDADAFYWDGKNDIPRKIVFAVPEAFYNRVECLEWIQNNEFKIKCSIM